MRLCNSMVEFQIIKVSTTCKCTTNRSFEDRKEEHGGLLNNMPEGLLFARYRCQLEIPCASQMCAILCNLSLSKPHTGLP